jgi:hypothetical protein
MDLHPKRIYPKTLENSTIRQAIAPEKDPKEVRL